ncbi:MAG: hypothetical protein IKI67_02090 [Bacteroidales bacterium]|nr:hypothetical protein [Bacteroidales bacterium]
MQTKSFLRMALVATLALGLSVSAQAQLKGVLNKAKKAAKEKAEKVVDQAINKSTNNAATTINARADEQNSGSSTENKQRPASVSSGPESPKIMSLPQAYNDYDEAGKYINEVAWGLRKTSLAEAKALANKLNARAKWIVETLEAAEKGSVKIEAEQKFDMKKELSNWDYFYGILRNIMNLLAPVQFQKDSRGLFYYQGSPMLMCGMHIAGNAASQEGVSGRNKSLLFTHKDNKSFFCSASLEPIFAEEDDIRVARLDLNMAENIAAMIQGYPIEWCRSTKRGVMQDEYDIVLQKALTYSTTLKAAIAGNSLSNLDFKPMPKAGSMNASLKSKALSVQKAKNKSCVDVVIVSNSWEVKKNSLGVPIRRIVYGYSISTTKHGKMATRVSWSEEYQGGSYGALRAYGVGAESFYVK